MIAYSPTEELNGMLQQQTPALISANVIAQQFGVESQALIDYCTAQGIFVAPIYNGGEYMLDFNNINEGFVRDFTGSLVAKSLEPQVQERLQAIASLRAAPTESATSTDTPLANKPWRVGKRGTSMRETVVNLIAHNDPSGEKGFLDSLRNQDDRATALVEKVIKTHYKSSTRSKNSLLKEIQSYLGEIEGNATAPTTEAPTETKPTTKRPRKTKAETAAQAS